MDAVFQKPGIVAWLCGGLGNQMFTAAAAWVTAQKKGCPLYFFEFGKDEGNEHNVNQLD